MAAAALHHTTPADGKLLKIDDNSYDSIAPPAVDRLGGDSVQRARGLGHVVADLPERLREVVEECVVASLLCGDALRRVVHQH